MFQGKTDKDWEFYGKSDPYFGVVTWDKFKRDNLDSRSKQDFFQTGEAYIAATLNNVEQYFCPNFHPTHTLDFGCGVGRLAIPLAATSTSVTGVDVSTSMLEEGQANCQELGIDNIKFIQGDDTLSNVSGTFDFIHSFIVFQHIPTPRGERILERLLNLLSEDGIGVLHFTYFHDSNRWQSFKYQAYKQLPWLWSLKNRIKGLSPRPLMEMNLYNLNTIFHILQDHGCHHLMVRFTHHSQRTGGAIIYFQKKQLPMF